MKNQLAPSVDPIVRAYIDAAIAEALVPLQVQLMHSKAAYDELKAALTEADATNAGRIAAVENRYQTDDRLTLTPQKVIAWLNRNGYR